MHETGHNLIMENRKKAVLSGVKEVGSFNEYEAVIYTNLGELKIKGKNIQISNINTDTGELILTGIIDSLHYSNNTERVPNNIITRFFK